METNRAKSQKRGCGGQCQLLKNKITGDGEVQGEVSNTGEEPKEKSLISTVFFLKSTYDLDFCEYKRGCCKLTWRSV